MIGDRKEHYAAQSEQKVSIMSLPWHNYTRFEINYAALLVKVSTYTAEVVQQYGESVHLLSQYYSYLVKLEFVEDFLVCGHDVLIKTHTVDVDLDV